MNVITNAQKYQAMREALNEFYWDNGISPLGTAAMLDTFAGEVNRLAQFIRDNSNDLDRDAQLQNGADDAGHDCTLCGGKRVVPKGDTKILCPACTVTVQS